MRKNYTMTEADYQAILKACQSVPYIAAHCGPIASPQERANEAWCDLGRRMGFDGMTVQPNGLGHLHFSAEEAEAGGTP